MVDITIVTTFLGWCAVINMGVLAFSTLWLMAFRDISKRIHSSMMNVDADALDAMYFQYLGNYKIAVIVFNIAPYLALKIMA